MKLDKFTWAVIGVVAVLLVAAVVTVNATGGSGVETLEYRTADEPETPVYNAFLALERGDLSMARAQYSKRVLEGIEEMRGYDPFSGRVGNPVNRRLRVTRVAIDPNDPNRAAVTVIQDNYSRGGPFGTGNTWSREFILEVVREDGAWKLNTEEYFY